MGARDNLRSTRSREDIDFDDEVRRRTQELRVAMLGAFVPERYNAVIEELGRIATDPRTPRRTRVQALAAYARAASLLVQQAPQVSIAAGVSVSAADLLRLVGEVPGIPTGCGPALSDPSTTIGLPTSTPSSGHGPRQAVVDGGSGDLRPREPEVPAPADREDGPPASVSSPAAPEATPPAPAQRKYLRCPRCGARVDDEPHACPVPEEGDPTQTRHKPDADPTA
jgi:hypothetical protein